MAQGSPDNQRRLMLKGLCGLAVASAVRPVFAVETGKHHRRVIPGTSESVPAIGMGTWITFDTPPGAARRDRARVLQAFFDHGGTVVDSSPMYGFAEATLGDCLDAIGRDRRLFSATKIWTLSRRAGMAQVTSSLGLWGRQTFDLLQVHNMVDWETHLQTLEELKASGTIRYIGITTSHGRRHQRMLEVIADRPEFDFVQFTYNIAEREAEERLLPAAAAHGKAVIINRPFRTGALFAHVQGKPLPDWADDIDCRNWAQFFLKFVISHPAVTCAIPATTRVDHMLENMGAMRGAMPDPQMRRRMSNYFDSL